MTNNKMESLVSRFFMEFGKGAAVDYTMVQAFRSCMREYATYIAEHGMPSREDRQPEEKDGRGGLASDVIKATDDVIDEYSKNMRDLIG